MLEKILIPVDGTSRAEAILEPLARLRRRRESHYVFLRVIQPPLAYPGMEAAPVVESDRAEAKAYFRELMGRLGAENVRVTGLIREGDPAAVILYVAKEEKATLIALATHGRTGFARWAWSGVADKVLRGARVPVFLTRSLRREAGWLPAEDAPFRRLLVPTDGTEAAALPAAAAIARECGAEIIAVHVVPDHSELVMGRGAAPDPPARPEAGRKVAADFVARLTDEGLTTRAVGAAGPPEKKILETAAALDVDLIVMSTHGRSGLDRWVAGSVAERVLRGTDVPMLVVRASRRAARRRAI